MEQVLHALAELKVKIEALDSRRANAVQKLDTQIDHSASLERQLSQARNDYLKAEGDLNAKIRQQRETIDKQRQQILDLQVRIDALLAQPAETTNADPA